MKKYDAYDNELTDYIDFLLGAYKTKDLVGDIIGDISDFDVPLNYVEGNQTIEAETPLGLVTINIAKTFYGTALVLSREIGGSIYEEYRTDLTTLPSQFLVRGRIIEEREKGVISTDVVRYYDYCNHDDADKRLVSSEETRVIFDNHQLDRAIPHLNLEGSTIKERFESLRNLSDLARLQKVSPLINTVIGLRIPHYIAGNYRRNYYPDNHEITVNNQSPILLYEFLNGNKTLERARDLLYGNITSKSVHDLKAMYDYTRGVKSKSYIYGFNRLADIQTSTNEETYSDHLSNLERDLIGPSKVKMSKEYYNYIRELINQAFDVELNGLVTPSNAIKLIRQYQGREKNEEKK